MQFLRFWFSERTDDVLAAFGVLLGIFVVANVLYGAKMLAGLDLLPGHYGSFFPAGQELYHAFGGR